MKLLIFVLSLFNFIGFKNLDFKPYTKTGYEQYEEFEVPKGRRILISYTDSEIERKYKDVPKGVFGTKEAYFDKYIPVKYKSTVIFSRSNKTRETYTFNYDLKTVNYSKVSVSVKGNISAKVVGKIKKVELTGQGDLSITHNTETSTETSESEKMNVVIHPNKKVTLRIVGEAMISNGVSKYYVLGICFKKGAFEIVEVTSIVYELLEEDA